MKLEDQCCNLSQAKRLKELGVKQESYASWFGDESHTYFDSGSEEHAIPMNVSNWVFVLPTKPANGHDEDHRSNVCITKPIASAFTVAELGEMLPTGYDTMRVTVRMGVYGWKGFDDSDEPCPHSNSDDVFNTEAEARAAMLIYLLESKLITPESINLKP